MIGTTLSLSAGLTVIALPGAAAAAPGPSTAAEAAQLVADVSARLDTVSEQVNAARDEVARQQEAVAAAQVEVDSTNAQLHELDGQIREVARSAFTGEESLPTLNLLLTSSSADDFVSGLSLLDHVADHTTSVIDEVSAAADLADAAQAAADRAAADAEQTLDDLSAQESQLTADVADYQRQFQQLTAAEQAAVRQEQTVRSGGTVETVTPAVASNGAAQAAVSTALAQVGDPYVYGASGPNSFDCSGLTQYAYAAAGVSLPHSSAAQSRMGTAVSRADLQPGDLLFFYSPVGHVAMYIGNGQMVHASTTGVPVKVVSIDGMGVQPTAIRRIV